MNKINFKDGKADGPFTLYHYRGGVSIKGNYKDGKETGLIEKFYQDGTCYISENFKDGKLDGIRKTFFTEYGHDTFIYKDGELEEQYRTDGRRYDPSICTDVPHPD